MTISWLRTPPPEEAPDDARAMFDAVSAARGFLPNVHRAFALNPDHFVQSFTYLGTLMAPEGGHLPRADKELMAVVVSAENRCPYCIASHGAALAAATGDATLARNVAVNYRHVELDPRSRALADFASKLTREPWAMQEADVEALRAHGLDDHAVLEAIEVVAFFNYTNRLASGMGLKADPEYLDRF
jgi:uncharacterized peroxidase-related enzyme